MGNISVTHYHSSKEKNEKFQDFGRSYKEDPFYSSFLKMSSSNGEIFFHISRLTNHNGDYIERIINFFKFEIPMMVGKSSFGSLYIYDDEGGRMQDEFELYILRKGKVEKKKDIYFSPFSEKISPEGISQM